MFSVLADDKDDHKEFISTMKKKSNRSFQARGFHLRLLQQSSQFGDLCVLETELLVTIDFEAAL